MKYEIKNLLERYISLLDKIETNSLGAFSIVLSTVFVMNHLEEIIVDPDSDPFPRLERCFNHQLGFLCELELLEGQLDKESAAQRRNLGSVKETAQLFEAAWTTYSDATYDHSVTLVENRLRQSGFDEKYFQGKTCFDGGCGTGRLSVALAKMGAKQVIAADIGGASLAYLSQVIKRHGLTNIELVEQDITSLPQWSDGAFDFVASNGVLHHTQDPIGGLEEHYRVTAQGGFFWIYLYGAGGFYWPIYDEMIKVVSKLDLKVVKNSLLNIGLREGLVYTYLDNVLAPRTYHSEAEVIEHLNRISPCEVRRPSGPAITDRPIDYIKTNYGRDILGPEGEVRLALKKVSNN